MNKSVVLAALAIAGFAAPAHAGLIGETVNVDYYYPDMATLYCSNGTAVVSAAVEYPGSCSGFAPVIIDLFDDGFSVDTQGSPWSPGAFNGFELSTVLGPDFDAVFYGGGTMGVTSLTVIDGALWINFAGQGGGIANFRFTLANGEVPEPAALGLLGLGLLGMAAARRRRG